MTAPKTMPPRKKVDAPVAMETTSAASSGASPSLNEACNLLLLNDVVAFTPATETLFKVLQNILQHPGEVKFCRLQRSSAAFSGKLARAKGAVRPTTRMQANMTPVHGSIPTRCFTLMRLCAIAHKQVRFLKACGFVEDGAGDEAALMLHTPDPEVLNAGKAALKALVKQHTQQYAAAVAEERRLQNEAAAQKLAQLKEVSKKNTAASDSAAEAERQQLLAGIKCDHEENARWKHEYDEMKK